MKAVVCPRYGSPEVLEQREIPRPEPGDDQVLIRVRATAVNSADVRVRAMREPGAMQIILRLVMGLRGPRNSVLGGVAAGQVVRCGRNVSLFHTGDEVIATLGMSFGGWAQYKALGENSPVALKPAGASFEEAAALIFGGTNALYFLEKSGLRGGQTILIHGASGAVGTSAVQIASSMGAWVSGVCSAANMELVRSLGAREVIDYGQTDYTSLPQRYDVVFDAAGYTNAGEAAMVLRPGGKFVTVASMDVAKERKSDLEELTRLYDAGKLKPVIDKIWPLEEIVEANRYVDLGHKRGNVVITVG